MGQELGRADMGQESAAIELQVRRWPIRVRRGLIWVRAPDLAHDSTPLTQGSADMDQGNAVMGQVCLLLMVQSKIEIFTANDNARITQTALNDQLSDQTIVSEFLAWHESSLEWDFWQVSENQKILRPINLSNQR